MARSIWSGAISFGLVNIPVQLYTAVRTHEIRFHILHAKDGVRVRQRLVCPLENREVERDETVRGYEVAPDQFVTVNEKELEAAAPEASRAIVISDFVNMKDIDPIYYDRPYYMLPDEGAVKPYKLLMDVMEKSGKVGIAKFVMRGKEYLAALRPANGAILLEIMHFAQEVIPARSVGALPAKVKITDAEMKMGQQLIDSMQSSFQPDKYRDEYTDKVKQLLEKKSRGEAIVVPSGPRKTARVINLMDALKESLRRTGSEARLPPKGKPARHLKIAQVRKTTAGGRRARKKIA